MGKFVLGKMISAPIVDTNGFVRATLGWWNFLWYGTCMIYLLENSKHDKRVAARLDTGTEYCKALRLEIPNPALKPLTTYSFLASSHPDLK